MEEYTINHIRTVLLVTLSVLTAIILYYRLLQYMKKDIDKRSYPVLLPFVYKDLTVQVSIELPTTAKVSLEILDVDHNCVSTLLRGDQEAGEVKFELALAELPANATFIRLSSQGHQVVRKIET